MEREPSTYQSNVFLLVKIDTHIFAMESTLTKINSFTVLLTYIYIFTFETINRSLFSTGWGVVKHSFIYILLLLLLSIRSSPSLYIFIVIPPLCEQKTMNE